MTWFVTQTTHRLLVCVCPLDHNRKSERTGILHLSVGSTLVCYSWSVTAITPSSMMGRQSITWLLSVPTVNFMLLLSTVTAKAINNLFVPTMNPISSCFTTESHTFDTISMAVVGKSLHYA